MAIKVIHDRANCIGCTACASVCPEFWRMNESDGKSDLIGGTIGENGLFEIEIEDSDLEANQNAVDVCPVQVIHIKHDSAKP